MIVALLDQKSDVRETTPALHLTGAWVSQRRHVTVVDTDPQGSALDWSAPRAEDAVPRLSDFIGFARNRLRREAPELRARIKVTAFQRRQTVADIPRDLLAREFPAANGGQT